MKSPTPVSQKAHTTLVQRLLATEDTEANRHTELMRRQENDRLRLALSQAQGVRDAASNQYTSLLVSRRSDAALVESQAKLEAAEAEVGKCAEALAAFEAAEQMRKHGPLGEIVMLLTVAVDELKTENDRFRAALTAAGIAIP